MIMAEGEYSTKELLLAAQQAIRERDQLRALWLEWLEGVYDGPDLLRRVKLAVHGPLRKPSPGVIASGDAQPKGGA